MGSNHISGEYSSWVTFLRFSDFSSLEFSGEQGWWTHSTPTGECPLPLVPGGHVTKS